MRLAWFKPRQPSAAWCGRRRQQIGSRWRSKETSGSRHPSSINRRLRTVARRRGHGVEAHAGIGAADERPELATSPKPSVPEHLLSPGAAPVRRLPIGAEPQPGGGVHFRLWAPRCREIVVEIEGLNPAALQSETDGYFSLWSLPARAGMRYRFRLDGGEAALPDPASRFQPEGPHGPSEIVDPGDFAWTDRAWRGLGARAARHLRDACRHLHARWKLGSRFA